MRLIKKIIISIIGQKNAWILLSKFRSKEQKELKKRRKDFYMQFLNKGDLYFDVGANFGNRIEPIINEGIKIIAVEPQTVCLDYLRVRYKGDIEIIPKGLSYKEEIKTLYAGDSNTISSFSEEWIAAVSETKRYGDNEWKESGKIDMTTMDILIDKFGTPNFVKIDVEGFEVEVLKGLSHKIPVISFEYTVPEESNKAKECLNIINKIGEGKIECNYSVAESMEWKLDNWLSYDEMIQHMDTNDFIKDGFGDIYVKTKI